PSVVRWWSGCAGIGASIAISGGSLRASGAAGRIARVRSLRQCRTARRGGHLHHCAECRRHHFVYHSCNHRACPRCGAREQAEWTRKQEARLLPVPYYLLTVTVPAEMRSVFLRFPQELYPAFFAAVRPSPKAGGWVMTKPGASC
ncbi:MAG: transposase zinc-binding domain-containing protein, partial [Terrimicrobiaceae bacterium]